MFSLFVGVVGIGSGEGSDALSHFGLGSLLEAFGELIGLDGLETVAVLV